MKKIYLTILFLAGLLVTSCDMDKRPYGQLDDQNAIQSLNDCLRFRNGLYGNLRAITTGSYVYATDIQADLFHGTIANGNRMGLISNGNILSSDGNIKGYWSGLYSVINSANYLIEKMDALIESAIFSEKDLREMKRYEGEARFVRAYAYYWLADHYCQTYSADKGDEAALGLPIVTVYHPTGDNSTYPGRSTLNELYSFIESEVKTAYDALIDYEKSNSENIAPNASYLSSYAILAFQARIALLKGDNATALAKAEEVIKSGKYPLTEIAEYETLWTKDEGTEVIFRPYMDNTELSNSTGETYLSTNLDNADYIPTFDVLSLYEDDGDIRFSTYFDVWELTDSKTQAYVFKKYPGNESLKTGSQPNYMNMSKPFRTSELYLIAAEAASSSNPVLANKYLNDLRSKRIEGYETANYTGQALVNAIRAERQKELLGEGFRLSDLRRWGMGFKRNPSHPENPAIENIVVKLGIELSYEVNDHRYVWPIPSDEMQNNPQLKGQQNPGY